MFERNIQEELLTLAGDYPVVTIVGPRQSGKTTLARTSFPKKPYINLEAIDTQELAKNDPRAFLSRYPEGAILDEIQRVPELLSYIQVIVDEREEKGLYILTGSHQFELHEAITQSLAGRTALLTLLPMSLQELSKAGFELSLDESLLCGGFPRIYQDQLDATRAYRNYFHTYIERDLRQLIQVKDLAKFQRFVKLLAGRIGQLINFENLGSDTGVSSHTIKSWISILEASYIITTLQPYFDNIGKRVIKTPKIYFTDVGLASYLLGIETVTQMERDPLRGHLFENLILLELMKGRLNQGLDPKLYFFRDGYGHEVDLIYQAGSELIPIEIKAGKTFSSDFLKNLRFFTSIAKGRTPHGYLIYSGDQKQAIEQFQILNYRDAATIVLHES